MGFRRSRDDGSLEIRRLEVSIILSSDFDTLIEELAFQVVAGTWSSKFLASKASGKSLVTLGRYEQAKHAVGKD